jgi:hypothetical protein
LILEDGKSKSMALASGEGLLVAPQREEGITW